MLVLKITILAAWLGIFGFKHYMSQTLYKAMKKDSKTFLYTYFIEHGTISDLVYGWQSERGKVPVLFRHMS